MSIAANNLPEHQAPILAADQEDACQRLLAFARVRASTTETALPVSVLDHWSVPLLIGPAASGKAFVCAEVARRWGGKPCRRWEVSGWILASNRAYHHTSEQIQSFVAGNPDGCVVYLAGIDALAVAHENYASYTLAVANEIAQFLSEATARPACFAARDGKTIPARVLVVVGGCFGALWGDATVGGLDRREAWRLADADPLADVNAVARWLVEDSSLPASILRRLAPEPLVLHRLDPSEAESLAARLRDRLPPSLDGLGTEEFSRALVNPSGWRAVAALVERAWVAGHEPLVSMDGEEPQFAPHETSEQSPQPEQGVPSAPVLPKYDSLNTLLPSLLGTRLGVPSNRSRLVAKARRLGLQNPTDLGGLATARGYLLPGEDMSKVAAWEKVSRDQFSDVELVAALLSPCLEWSERAICRGALMLAALLVLVAPESIVYEARRARGELVLRHVAWIGAALHPQHRRWRDLLLVLPTRAATPAFAPGLLPDEAIRHVLSLAPRQ